MTAGKIFKNIVMYVILNRKSVLQEIDTFISNSVIFMQWYFKWRKYLNTLWGHCIINIVLLYFKYNVTFNKAKLSSFLSKATPYQQRCVTLSGSTNSARIIQNVAFVREQVTHWGEDINTRQLYSHYITVHTSSVEVYVFNGCGEGIPLRRSTPSLCVTVEYRWADKSVIFLLCMCFF